MNLILRTSILAFVIAISGCSYHKTPYIMSHKSTPHSNTAVFVSEDAVAENSYDSRITHVDGNKPSCIQVGCPYWVRVDPGKHKFTVRFTSNFYWSTVSSGYSYANLDIEIPNMKAQHVYVVRYYPSNKQVHYSIEDLGKNPKFSLHLGSNFFPVSFSDTKK